MKGCSPSPDSACIRLPGLLGVIHNAATIFFGFYSFATHRTKTRPCSTNGASGPLKALYGTSKAKPRLSVLRSFEGSSNPPLLSLKTRRIILRLKVCTIHRESYTSEAKYADIQQIERRQQNHGALRVLQRACLHTPGRASNMPKHTLQLKQH